MTTFPLTIAQRRMVCAVVNRYGAPTGPDGQPHATDDSREILLALFCANPTARQRAERPEKARETAADIAEAARMEQRRTADPATTQHITGDPGPWRAKVCAWGRDHGWPDAVSRQVLDAELVAAYRAAHAGEAS